MRLLKLAPAAALALSGAALLILALAPLGTALGWWDFRFGLYSMMPAVGYAAAAAVVLAVATLALGWSRVRARGRLVLAVALVMGAILAYVPWNYQRIRSTLPPIHDITTDTDNPPAFVAVLPARAAENAGSVIYDMQSCRSCRRGRIPISRRSWPRCRWRRRSIRRSRSPGRCRDGPLLPSMPVPAASRRSSRAAGSDFTDDVVIRISGDEAGSRIDMRSTSRQGRSDYGVNVARIRAYMTALRQRLG